MKDGVTLKTGAENSIAAEYGRRCEKIGQERHDIHDVQAAMSHPHFKAEHHALVDRLAQAYRTAQPLLARPARFTLKLGAYGTKKEMIESVKSKGHRITDLAMGVIRNDQFLMLKDEGEYDFFETTVKEMTGQDWVTHSQLYAVMCDLNFIYAPYESALAIREAYDDQPEGDIAVIVSEPLAVTGYNLLRQVLQVEDNGRGHSIVQHRCAEDHHGWHGCNRILVCRKRS